MMILNELLVYALIGVICRKLLLSATKRKIPILKTVSNTITYDKCCDLPGFIDNNLW